MWKVTVKNTINNGMFEQDYYTEELADTWIADCVLNNLWGDKARSVVKSGNHNKTREIPGTEHQVLIMEQYTIDTFDADGNVIATNTIPAKYEEYIELKAEYEITKIDLSKDSDWVKEQKDNEYIKAGSVVGRLKIDIEDYVTGYNGERSFQDTDTFSALIYPIFSMLLIRRYNQAYKMFKVLPIDGTYITQDLYDGIDRLFIRSGLPLN
jgi:hypothetical protein